MTKRIYSITLHGIFYVIRVYLINLLPPILIFKPRISILNIAWYVLIKNSNFSFILGIGCFVIISCLLLMFIIINYRKKDIYD